MHSSFEAYSVQIDEKRIRRGSSGARSSQQRVDIVQRCLAGVGACARSVCESTARPFCRRGRREIPPGLGGAGNFHHVGDVVRDEFECRLDLGDAPPGDIARLVRLQSRDVVFGGGDGGVNEVEFVSEPVDSAKLADWPVKRQALPSRSSIAERSARISRISSR
jgi:hypothetical protein